MNNLLNNAINIMKAYARIRKQQEEIKRLETFVRKILPAHLPVVWQRVVAKH